MTITNNTDFPKTKCPDMSPLSIDQVFKLHPIGANLFWADGGKWGWVDKDLCISDVEDIYLEKEFIHEAES